MSAKNKAVIRPWESICMMYILRVVGKLLFGPVVDKHHLELTDATWWERPPILVMSRVCVRP